MRIVQLIDSLEAGGAERMAVNYANALAKSASFSGLVATRAEGSLIDSLNKDVSYLFLSKKSLFDFVAIKKLANYCTINKIDIMHGHSTSIFLAVMVRFFNPSLRIVWHDHYGNSEYLESRPALHLKFLSRFCASSISVNTKLLAWSEAKLNFKERIYLPNFAVIDELQEKQTSLYGEDGKRIICVANLREQKNHLLLLDVAMKLKESHPKWTFHFIGKDFNDDLSQTIKQRIATDNLQDNVYLYGSCTDTSTLIRECDIAVLSSKSEGLPVVLLEYGLLSKAVLSTAVGEIASIIQNAKNGYLAKSGNVEEFYLQLLRIIDNDDRGLLGENLHKTVLENYGAETVINSYLKWLAKI